MAQSDGERISPSLETLHVTTDGEKISLSLLNMYYYHQHSEQ
jgi:hypothetical protein